MGEGRERALRLDEYSVWISHHGARLPVSGSGFTFSCGLALESYPVNEAAVVQLDFGHDAKVSFSLDRWGYLLAAQRDGAFANSCKSVHPIPQAHWHHVAAVFNDSGATIYIDGEACGHTAVSTSVRFYSGVADVTLARSPDCPIVANVFPTGVLNGLLRDVRVFDGPLSPADLGRMMEEAKPSNSPDLQINGAWCADDPQRPQYHAIPPRAWTNEPHGLIRWGGQYHLFYQKNPNGPYWGHIHWGHMTSPDLYRWTEVPAALSPNRVPTTKAAGQEASSITTGSSQVSTPVETGTGPAFVSRSAMMAFTSPSIPAIR